LAEDDGSAALIQFPIGNDAGDLGGPSTAFLSRTQGESTVYE
jgi:hypothetical protein